MALNSIRKEWDGFADMVFDGHEPTNTQRNEMKKAFFAGAWTIINATSQIAEPDVTEDEAVRYLENRRMECKAFQDQLLEEHSSKRGDDVEKSPSSTTPKLMVDMTEPELSTHFKSLVKQIDERQPSDVIGTMVISFMDNGISQYAASILPEDAPAALHELADRLDRRDTVTRQ